MTSAVYYLRRHAFVCPTLHHWIILDAKHDQYLAVGRAYMEALAPWLIGFGGAALTEPAQPIDCCPDARELAHDLLARDILSVEAVDSKPVRPDEFVEPQIDIETPEARTFGLGSAIALLQVWRCCSKADRLLRSTSLYSILHAISTRRTERCCAKEGADLEKVTALVAQFQSLRFFYPRVQLCLFSSFALLEYLAQHEVFPSWIFGIQPDPLEAHCWLQLGATVINDAVDNVKAFRPIMRV